MKQKENKIKQVQLQELKHLKFEVENEEHIVTLVDSERYSITKGYGKTIIEAMNDMHHNLI